MSFDEFRNVKHKVDDNDPTRRSVIVTFDFLKCETRDVAAIAVVTAVAVLIDRGYR